MKGGRSRDTHPNDRTDKPSVDDIEIAKRVHKTIFVVSRSGLWAVDPGGVVSQVFKNSDWMSQKNPKEQKHGSLSPI